jgi:hypothetical protein
MILEELLATGTLHLQLFDEDGNIKEDRLEENLVVTAGLGFITSRMKDATATAMSHMAVGTGATAAAAGNTTLGTEAARVALDSTTLVTTTVTNDSIQYVATFPAGTGTAALTEAGILNNSSGGTLLNRVVFSVINKGASDSLVITWKVTFA